MYDHIYMSFYSLLNHTFVHNNDSTYRVVEWRFRKMGCFSQYRKVIFMRYLCQHLHFYMFLLIMYQNKLIGLKFWGIFCFYRFILNYSQVAEINTRKKIVELINASLYYIFQLAAY